jgi:nitric oxide reductase large subunit
MTAPPETEEGTLSPWWRRAVIATMAIGFAVLILLTAKAYQNAPPIPGCAVHPSGKVVFTSAEIALGQQVFRCPSTVTSPSSAVIAASGWHADR